MKDSKRYINLKYTKTHDGPNNGKWNDVNLSYRYDTIDNKLYVLLEHGWVISNHNLEREQEYFWPI